MGLAQIGEFSFIIASLGMSLKVTSDFLYPITVAVSAITTLFTPYLIRASDPLSAFLSRLVPERMADAFNQYGEFIRNIHPEGDKAIIAGMIRRIVIQVAINLVLVIAIFLCMAFFAQPISRWLATWGVLNDDIQKALIWGAALLLSLSFLIAAYRKLKALSMMLAEMGVKGEHMRVRKIVSEVIPIISIATIMLLIAMLSSSILPTGNILLIIALTTAVVIVLLRGWFIRVHSRMQIALLETLENSRENEREGH